MELEDVGPDLDSDKLDWYQNYSVTKQAPHPSQQLHPNINNSQDLLLNAGNWGDDFPAAGDNVEYADSFTESKVFTPSGSPQAKSAAVGEPVNGPVPHPSAVVSSPGGPAAVGVAGSVPGGVPGGSSYTQPIDISALLQEPGGLADTPSAASGGPTASLSPYNQSTTLDLKSAIGIVHGGGGAKTSSEQLAPSYGSSSYSFSSVGAVPGFTSTISDPSSSFISTSHSVKRMFKEKSNFLNLRVSLLN
jgi:hypothetical protein